VRARLLIGFVLFAFIATAILVIPIGLTLEAHESANALRVIRRDTRALAVLLTDALNHSDLQRAVELSDEYAASTGRQVMVVDKAGVLLASRASQGHDRKLLRIVRSVHHLDLSGISPNTAVEGAQYYVAVPLDHVISDHPPVSHVVLVVTSPVKSVNDRIRNDWKNLGLYGLVMLLLACLFGFIISGSLVRPLRQISRAVEAVGSGSLEVRAPESAGPRELRVLAQVINSTSARLITLLEAQRTFVEDASHQLRTPLTSLQLHLENLRSGAVGDTSDLDNVLVEMNRLSRMVESLLALARNEARSSVLVPIDVRELVDERAEVWRPLAGELDIALEVSADKGLVAFAVEDALEQILDNLLANAFDAIPEGGRVRLDAKASDGRVELHVIDNGPGLDESEREFALHRFWRGRGQSGEGTGLGLAIVDQLVQLSGGSVELREAVGGGLDATIVLRRLT